jgi:hypothetical protein
MAGALLVAIAIVGAVWPLVIVVPLALVLLWLGVALMIRAGTLRKERRSQGLPATRVSRAAVPPPVAGESLKPQVPERQKIEVQG